MRARGVRWFAAATAALCGTAIVSSCSSVSTSTSAAPKYITVGTLYASVGQFSTSSQAQFAGLQFWIKTVNSQGGVYVKAYGKKIPVKLIAYDDESQTSLASREYTKLVTEDHVDIPISDFGSVLTSVGVPVAQENGATLFDPTASTPTFFTESIFGNGNPDLVLTSLPSSAIWPKPLAQFLLSVGARRVAIVQSANDFDAAQATTVKDGLSSAGIVPVYSDTVQTSTNDYSSIVPQIQAANPDAVLEFGYGTNDVAFLRALDSANYRPKLTFTIFPGENLRSFEAQVPPSALAWTYTYVSPLYLSQNQVNYGMTTQEFVNAFEAANPGSPVNFLNIAGYQAGLIAQATLGSATSMTPVGLRIAAAKLSGHLQTLEGTFALDRNGSQVGLYQPVGQIVPGAAGGLTVEPVFPSKYATTRPTFPAPTAQAATSAGGG